MSREGKKVTWQVVFRNPATNELCTRIRSGMMYQGSAFGYIRSPVAATKMISVCKIDSLKLRAASALATLRSVFNVQHLAPTSEHHTA